MARNPEHHQKMTALAGQWRISGQSIKSFALANGINPFTLRYWANKQKAFNAASDRFLQLPAPNSYGCINIRYPNGTVIELPANTPMGIVKQLLAI